MAIINAKNCPICNTGMTVRTSLLCDGHSQPTPYRLAYCRLCGYGATNTASAIPEDENESLNQGVANFSVTS